MARADKKSGELVFESNNKRFEASPMYLQTIFEQINKMGDTIVQNEKAYSNANIDIHTKFIMALIIDPVKREEIKEYRQERINNEINDTMAVDQSNKAMFEINMDTIGECITAYDDFLGIVRKQEIMRVASPKLKELEKKALEKYE
jgi:hypothetical protein